MAQIGLKVDHGSVGTDLANTLVKALMGDPRDEAYMAQTRSSIMNDEVSRREREQNILRIKADEARLLGEEARKASDAEYSLAEVPYVTQLVTAVDGSQTVQPVATEPPVPIKLESGGRGMPEHLVPLATPAAEMPVPVEIGAIDETGMRGAPGDTGFLGVQRGVPGELGTPTSPLATLGDRLGEPVVTGPRLGSPDLPGDRLTAATEPTGPRLGEPVLKADRLVIPDPNTVDPGSFDLGVPPVAALPAGDPRFGTDMPVPVAEPVVATAALPPDIYTPQGGMAAAEMPVPVDTAVQAVDAVKTAATAPMPTAPDTLTQPEATVATAAATSPSGKPDPTPVQPMPKSTLTIKGADDGKADTAATVQTTRAGPIPREGIEAMVRSIMYGPESPEVKMQAVQRLMGTLGATYNPQFGQEGQEALTENIASLRQGGAALGRESVLGTPAAIEYATKTGDIKTTMIGDRAYTLTKTPDGRTVATLVEGQPAPKAASRFGESAEGTMRESISTLLVSKPDPKTWDAKEKQDYAMMVDTLYGAKVTVSENGKIVVTEGNLPEGVLPGSAGFSPQEPPPPTGQPEGQAAPATPAPAAQPPAAAEGGRPTETIDGVQVKNYGGWLRAGEQPKQVASDTAAGKVTQIEGTGPTDMDEQVGKEFGYTKNVLTPGKYLLDLTADKVPNVTGQVLQAAISSNSLLQVLGSEYLSPQEREYFQNVQRFINAVTHKSSGADVTAADLRTYGYLFSLPPKKSVKGSDLRILKNGVLEDIKNSRTGWNGRVPNAQLRDFDIELARKGYDLDKVYTDEDAGASTSPVRRRRVGADGKLEDAG